MNPRAKMHLVCAMWLIASTLWGKDNWLIGEHENITVLSNVGEERTQTVFEHIVLFDQAMPIVSNGSIKPNKWPLRVVVCRDYEEYIRMAPELVIGGESRSRSFFEPAYDLVVARWELEDYISRTLYYEMGKRALRNDGNTRLWLEEGFGEVSKWSRFDTKELMYGFPISYYGYFFRYRPPMRLGRLFSVDEDSEDFLNETKRELFSATSWAFVHMCLFADDGGLRKPLTDFGDNLRYQKVSEKMFVRHFGKAYEEMRKKLTSYVTGGGAGRYSTKLINKRLDVPEVELNEAGDFFVFLYFGSSAMANGDYQEARHYFEKCQEEMGDPDCSSSVETQNKCAQLYAELATLESYVENFEEAVEFADQALDSGSDNPSVLLIHAESVVGLKPGERTVEQLSLDQVNEALTKLNRVFRYSRTNRRAHRLHTIVWRYSDQIPDESHVKALLLACQLYPADKEIHFNVAEVFRRSGKGQYEIIVLEHFINSTQDEDSLNEAKDLLKEIVSGN